MSKAVLFKDLYKPFSDLQTKLLDASKKKLELKVDNGPELVLSTKGAAIEQEVLVKFPVDLAGQNFVVKAKGLASGALDITTEYKDNALTVTDVVSFAGSSVDNFVVTANYETAQFAASSELEMKKGLATTTASIVGSPAAALLVGAQVKYPIEGAPAFNFGLRATHADYQLGATTDLANVKLAVLRRWANSARNVVGAEYVRSIAKPAKDAPGVTSPAPVALPVVFEHAIGLVGEHAIGTRSFKGRIELPTGELKASFSDQLRKNVSVTFAASSNLISFSGVTWGVNLLVDRVVL